MCNRALIAMSGGVDSSVAAWLMVQKGFECTGAMMKLFDNDDIEVSKGKTCCSLDDANDARAVAFRIGIPFYVFNFSDCFKQYVMERFVEFYKRGMTPNPCIDCNRYLKFERFLRRARELDIDYIVTGHYARIERNAQGRYILKKGVDASKDQSYVLYSMTQEQLAHTLFPLGGMQKSQVREIAQAQGFINAQKSESQDICFVPNGKYAQFIEKYTGDTFEKGNFVDTHGNVIGEHKGIVHYTIGQRKGLGLSQGKPVYVSSIHPENNTVVIGDEQAVYSNTLIAGDVNLIPVESLEQPMRVKAKLRYKQPEQPATVWQLDENTIQVEFDSPQRAITKGQAVVLYDGETVVGGGTIM